ncbi:YegP family protein [Ignatzschineria larvae DSM 13226]|uniref:YegP family protein n=1 Tax=Ignatzschineria larvae DSM 13226 TaxID=1111732 RepID=A0ABZ3BYA6_9GAMM|nr:YegP family protein [Ignatzschineria larvae]
MSGKFEIFLAKNDKFYFRLKAGNGEIILSSQGYATKTSCKKGIASVQKNSVDPNRYEKKSSDTGKFSFNLKATNGQVVGSSQSYKSESGCDNGIKSVTKNAADATIVDLTAE